MRNLKNKRREVTQARGRLIWRINRHEGRLFSPYGIYE